MAISLVARSCDASYTKLCMVDHMLLVGINEAHQPVEYWKHSLFLEQYI